MRKERKHVTQMNIGEEIYCQTRAMITANRLTVIKHAKTRNQGKGLYIDPEDILHYVSRGHVIEYERVYVTPTTQYFGDEGTPVVVPSHTDSRVVIRCPYQFGEDISFVLDITNNSLVTLWTNRTTDQHNTLNLSEYNPNLKIY